MSVKIQCPNCRREYNVGEQFLGRKVVCKNDACGAKFQAATAKRVESVTELAERVVNQHPAELARPRAASETGHSQRNLGLYLLAGIPSLLLLAGVTFYWSGGFNRPMASKPVGGQSEPRIDNSVKNAVDHSDKSGSNSIPVENPVDDLEVAAFRKSVAKFLCYIHFAMQSSKRYMDINDKNTVTDSVESGPLLGQLRSRIGVPPAGLKSRKEIQQKLDVIMDGYRSGVSSLKSNFVEPVPPVTFAEAIQELRSVDGHPLPEETLKTFDEITKVAGEIANELGITFDESHSADEFFSLAVELTESSRKCISGMAPLPALAQASKLDAIAAELDLKVKPSFVTIKWTGLPDPPQATPERPKLIAAFKEIHKNIVKANRSYRFLRHSPKKLTSEQVKQLVDIHDQALDTARLLLNEVEPLLKTK